MVVARWLATLAQPGAEQRVLLPLVVVVGGQWQVQGGEKVEAVKVERDTQRVPVRDRGRDRCAVGQRRQQEERSGQPPPRPGPPQQSRGDGGRDAESGRESGRQVELISLVVQHGSLLVRDQRV